ncbi:hypothetical protein CCR80_02575 [Rhodothalassium salexigens]|uniref:LytTR family transcriptional regulator DNA-binding domain-containing protein n=1 Tax=Rhodothalassium salexigens TaxID=1086 RepID=UPI00191131F9|nr:LytTR family transcriptional regulator DNA-binding domain-containing protein [Rhodothalassium salexigens]MBK5919922.1 hypothetical protein [Rhodothalassium salexigens]
MFARTTAFNIAFVLIVGTLLAASGVYGTGVLGWPRVWLYWIGLIAVGFWLGTAISGQLARMLPVGRAPWMLRWLLLSAALSAPMCAVVATAQIMIDQPIPASALWDLLLKVAVITAAVVGARQLADMGGAGAPDLAESPPTEDGSALSAPTAAAVPPSGPSPIPSPGPALTPAFAAKPTSDPLAAPRRLTGEPPVARAVGSPSVAPDTAPSTAAAPSVPAAHGFARSARLARRLPAKLQGAEIWALSAEDHYVRVHTAQGEALILIRFADAIAEMAPIPGARTHRSWWVARAGIRTAERRREGGVVVLKSGVQVPVSRSRAAEIAARDWFDAD